MLSPSSSVSFYLPVLLGLTLRSSDSQDLTIIWSHGTPRVLFYKKGTDPVEQMEGPINIDHLDGDGITAFMAARGIKPRQA
jgi:hypothetical protein